MVYRMPEKQYNSLKNQKMTHEDIINYVNNMMGFVHIEQSYIDAVDRETNDSKRISLDALGISTMRIIEDVIVF